MSDSLRFLRHAQKRQHRRHRKAYQTNVDMQQHNHKYHSYNACYGQQLLSIEGRDNLLAHILRSAQLIAAQPYIHNHRIHSE